MQGGTEIFQLNGRVFRGLAALAPRSVGPGNHQQEGDRTGRKTERERHVGVGGVDRSAV
jgi:hypothetical protein